MKQHTFLGVRHAVKLSPTYSLILSWIICSLLYGLSLTLLTQAMSSLTQQAVRELIYSYRVLEKI